MRRLLIVLLLLFTAQTASAQGMVSWLEQGSINQASAFNAMNQVKGEIDLLLQYNNELQAEYDALLTELRGLEEQIQKYKAQFVALGYKLPSRRALEKKNRRVSQDYYSLNQMEGDVLIKENQILKLRSDILEIDERLKLWKLRLSELQLQKREWEIGGGKDQQAKAVQDAAVQEMTEEARNELKAQIQGNIRKEREYQKMVQEFRGLHNVSSREIVNLKEDNELLKAKIKDIKRELNIKNKELALFEKKEEWAKKSLSLQIAPQMKRKKELESLLGDLEAEYNTLSQTASEKLASYRSKKAVMKEVIDADKENQKLRQKIDDLKKRIEEMDDY